MYVCEEEGFYFRNLDAAKVKVSGLASAFSLIHNSSGPNLRGGQWLCLDK